MRRVEAPAGLASQGLYVDSYAQATNSIRAKHNRVYEGDPIVLLGNPMDNADLTQEYLYGAKYGAGIILSGNNGIGRYEFTSGSTVSA